MTENSSQAHLLVIDDDELMRAVAVKKLRNAGFKVTDVASGDDALAIFARGSFDLVLLDVMMVGMDGFEVCTRIRATNDGARVPILILTGLKDTKSIDVAYLKGATDFITKPINWTLLSHRVRYALRLSDSAKAMRRSRESLARAQRIAGMGNWTMSADGLVECSPELLLLFDEPADASYCSTATEFLEHVTTPHRDRVAHARAQLLRDGTPYRLEFEIGSSDGKLRTVFEQAAA